MSRVDAGVCILDEGGDVIQVLYFFVRWPALKVHVDGERVTAVTIQCLQGTRTLEYQFGTTNNDGCYSGTLNDMTMPVSALFTADSVAIW